MDCNDVKHLLLCSRLHPLNPRILRILPEIIHLTIGMGHNAGIVFDIEAVPEDGGYEFRQSGIAGIGGVVEGVLAIAVGVVEADAFR